MKKRFVALLMALAMVLAYMPAMAFAEDAVADGISYKGELHYVKGSDYVNGLYEEGSTITVTYGGVDKNYIYKIYQREPVGDGYNEYGEFFLNGDVKSEYLENFNYGFDSQSGIVTLILSYYDDEGNKIKDVTKAVQAEPYPVPKSVKYTGADLRYEHNDDYIENLFKAGNKLTVTYDNGTVRTYICKNFTENGEPAAEYFLDGKIVKNSYGEYDYVRVAQKWVKRPLGTKSTVLTYEEYVGGGDSYTVNFTVPLKYYIGNDIVVKKPVAAKKAFTAKWSRANGTVHGYQVQYSTSKSFKSAKSKLVAGKKKTSVKISNLKAKKKYYVRVRTYRTYNKKKYYSEWSAAKTVKTK